MNTGFIWGIRSRNGKESYNNLNTANARRSRKMKGFTLVELIVVLVIIAILAAIAVPTLIGFIDRAKEKNVKMAGQKALAATQTALSDIYADAGNRYSPDKRANTRTLAAVDTTENKSDTEFTVWNEKRLWDGHTVAIADNVGSYTVSKALYREGELFAAYNGKEWEVFDEKTKAMDWLNIDDSSDNLTDNVIYVWPYAQDYAYLDVVTPIDDSDGPGKDAIIKEVTLKLPRTTLSHVFFAKEGRSSNSGKESVKVVFWKESEESSEIKSYWTIDGDNKNLFKVDNYNTYWINIVNSEDHTYSLKGWKEEEDGWETTDIGKSAIQERIFAQTGQDKFAFVALVNDEEFIPKIATLNKAKFQQLFQNQQIEGVIQTQSGVNGAYTEAQVSSITGKQGFDYAKSRRVDDSDAREGEDGHIYAWIGEDNYVHWWTNATTVYLPEYCDNFFANNTNIKSFNFSGFDASRVKDMYYMFFGAKNLTSVTFGESFYANNLNTTLSMFDGCSNLESIDLEKFNAKFQEGTDPVISSHQQSNNRIDGRAEISYMFKGCEKLGTIRFSDSFETSKVKSWQKMFLNCKNATVIDVAGLNTQSAENMEWIFKECNKVEKLDLSGWKLHNVTNLYQAFNNDYALSELKLGSGWNLQNCTTMYACFDSCSNLKGCDFHEIKTSSKLSNVECLFKGCAKIENLNIKEWDVSGVHSMKQTFYNCSAVKTIDIANWITPNLESLENTFSGCSNVELIDMSNWNMEKVKTMESAFNSLKKLKRVEMGDRGWNLKACTSLKGTFEYCSSLNQSFEKLQTTSALEYMNYTFNGCTSLSDLDLRNVNAEGIKTMDKTFMDCTALETLNVSTWNTRSLKTLIQTFKNCKKLTYIDMSNWQMQSVTNMDHTFAELGALQTIVTGDGWDFQNCNEFKYTFERCKVLSNFDASKIKTSDKLSNIEGVFSECEAIEKLDLSGWNTENVTTMLKSFYNCKKLTTLDVSTWNTGNLTDLANTFQNCNSLTEIDMRSWNLRKVTRMYNLFQNAKALTEIKMGDGWQLNSCKEMYNAFNKCEKLNQDFHEISTTENLNNIASLFNGMTSLTRLDLRNWNLTGVNTNCVDTFKDCSKLRRIYANSSTCGIPASKQSLSMFSGCDVLEGGNGTTIASNNNNTTAKYAWVDGAQRDGSEQVGYFTDKPTSARLVVTNNNWIWDNVKINGATQVRRVDIVSFGRNRTFTKDQVLAIAGVKDLSDSNYEDGYPVYFWIDNNKAIQWWSEADTVYVHEDAVQMFMGWENAQISLEDFNLSKVRNLSGFFKEDAGITSIDISEYTLSNVTNMTEMFSGCTSLQSVKMSIDTSNSASDVSMSSMFQNNTALTNVSITGDWSKVSNLSNMFTGDKNLSSIDFGESPDMSNLKTVYYMLHNITTQNDSDTVFNAFAGTFKKWNLGDNQLFEKQDKVNTTNKITNIAPKVDNVDKGYFINKPIVNTHNGKTYEVQDNKYLFRKP